MTLPHDYDERVYAGWLGKCIGVQFGGPIESWTYEEIRDNIGELTGYLNEAPGKLFKPDDDTAFPMVLIRALEDYGPNPTAQQLSDTRQNYLGDGHGTLWWGGYGVSSEHTAYSNAAGGIPAPLCGSASLNGWTLAEQIGGQIFSDIWGLVAPNRPAFAADLAERASSISHDGNGLYGARFIAGMISHAFSERDPFRLVDMGLSLIPADSEYARVVRAVLGYYQQGPDDWRAGFGRLKANFGYDRYPGVVHIIPNAGVIVLALAYGGGDFSRTLQIANMCGWDTDCNVGNVGAIMGVAVGLDGIDWAWRAPINDLLIAASIIGTRNILTIPQCADLFCRLGYQIAGQARAPRPRYHFAYPGSTSNFLAHGERGRVIELRAVDSQRALQASVRKLERKGEIKIYTRTYYRPHELSSNYYEAAFSPLIYPGQTVTARVYLPPDAPDAVRAGVYVYDDNHGESYQAQATDLIPGTWHTLTYTIPALANACLSEVGIVVRNLSRSAWTAGAIYLGSLDWSGVPDFSTDFRHERPESGGISQWTRLRGFWRLADGAYHGSGVSESETYSGDPAWGDVVFEVTLVPLVGDHHCINGRVQGALRSYALGLAPHNKLALYKKNKVYREVAAVDFPWTHGTRYHLMIRAQGDQLVAAVCDDAGVEQSLVWRDDSEPYLTGQIGLSTWHGGHTRYESVRVHPVEQRDGEIT
jgi:ADP-ribosylglycohydrolase